MDGHSIICQNKTGGTGVLATQYVHDQAADGYNLLLGAENPALYKILGLSDITYDDYDTILLIGSEDVSIVVPNDSPYNSVQELVDAAKADPGKLIYSATGSVKILATLTTEPVEELPGTKPITDEIPEFAEYLPFGPFYGVWVNKGTPDTVEKVLSDIFKQAYESDEYQEVLKNLNVKPLGLTGDEANTYISDWTKSTAKALYSAGLMEKSPAELGLE